MDTTPLYGFPFQELTDAPDGPSLGEDLALAVEGEIERVDADIAKITGLASVRADQPFDEPTWSSTTWTAGTTPCQVAFVAPPSGEVMVHLKAYFVSNINDRGVFVDSEVRTGAAFGGGSVVPGGTANSNDGLVLSGTVTSGVPLKLNSGTFKRITGLTPGSSYHARVMYVVETGGGIQVLYRQLVIVPSL